MSSQGNFQSVITSSSGVTLDAFNDMGSDAIVRTGPTSATTDTLDSTNNMANYLSNDNVNYKAGMTYVNLSTVDMTIVAGDAGTTLVGNMTISPGTCRKFFITGYNNAGLGGDMMTPNSATVTSGYSFPVWF